MGLLRSPLAWAVLIAGTPAYANPVDVFGLTSRRAGQANVGVGGADDASALYYNPGGLVATPGGELVVGTVGAYSHLSINTNNEKLRDPAALQLGVRTGLPLGGVLEDRFAIGIALHILPKHVARIIAPPPDEPFYPYYGDRLSRLVVLPGAAARLGHGISLGTSINVLAALGGTIFASEGATRSIDARVDAAVPSIARVIAGAQWQASPTLRFGAVYRQRFELPFETRTRTIVAGEPIDLDLRATSQFTPHQIGAGVQWSSEAFATALDIGWAKWSGYPGPFVRVDSRLPLVGPVPGQPPKVPFEDTFSVRAGIESVAAEGIVYRGGYGFETSPVPRGQTGVTNLLDGNRHTITFGGGYIWKRVRIDAHVQVQLVTTRKTEKVLFDGMGEYDPYTSLRDEDSTAANNQITNPGYPDLKSGGEVFSAGFTVAVPL